MSAESLSATNTNATSGWPLALRIALVLTLGSLVLLGASGVGEDGVRTWIRATARASVSLFLMAFVARPLHQLWRSSASSWLLANRRYLGASAAYAQLLHGIALVWLFRAWPAAYEADVVALVGGGLGFALYFAMGLSSNDAAVAALGKRAWKTLHSVGAYWIWVIFAVTNWGNVELAFSGKLGLGHRVLYAAIQAALVGALALRIAAWARARRRA